MSDVMRYGSCSLWIMLVMWLWTPSARAQSPVQSAPQQSSATHSSEDLSARATDPTAALMSFSFVNDFHISFYDLDDQGFEFRFQPVVPFRAWGASNILRIVVPYQGSGPGNEGLKDVSIFDLIIVPQRWGRLAIGPVMSFYQSESDAASKFAAGPAIGVVKPLSKRLLVGAFSQNLFAACRNQSDSAGDHLPARGWVGAERGRRAAYLRLAA